MGANLPQHMAALFYRFPSQDIRIEVNATSRYMWLRDAKSCVFAYTRKKAELTALRMKDNGLPEPIIRKWVRHMNQIWPLVRS